MNKYSVLTICVLLLMSCEPKYDVPVTIDLHRDWQFKSLTDSVWKSATVPGNVHSDLLENKITNHPFIGNNEDSLQWVSETDWEYKANFSVDKQTLQKKHIALNFEGLDTYASVYLNDSLILQTSNAFRQFSVNVKPLLKPQNVIHIVFERTSISEEKAKNTLNYTLPEGNRIFTRKAQFQYGWDWGPKLNTSGIWRPVTLNAWNDYKIDDMYIKQLNLNDSVTDLLLEINKISTVKLDKILTYDIYINDKLHTSSKEVLKGYTWATKFQIKKPKRWWPHNLGEPYLYDIKVVVRDKKTILDSVSVKKGLRTIELITEKDSFGESFFFKVNEIPVYIKGANYIPQNSMQDKVTDDHCEILLNHVVDANMNMLRVWGGGIYENDIFYDSCDEKGILVWQDFMFACAMYPGDADFLKNVQQEAIQNVKRLRNHASIALWCGNNENSEGWQRWGWKDGRSEDEKDEIWSHYLKVFDSILPNTVSELTDTNYWESSPKYGRGNPNYKTEGDAHDWWVWHDGYPFEHFENNVPRFMSEFGFQSLPSYETIQYINQSDSIAIVSESFKNHQKHGRGFQLIDDYMHRDFPVPTHSEDYVYVSQLLQAYGITKGIEAHRRAKPYNMGTLYWQLNDCWPAISWSSIDYFGNWKALHYGAKKSFENFLISSHVTDQTLRTYAINDNLKDVNLHLDIELIDFEGKIIWNDRITDTIIGNDNKLIFTTNLNDLKFDTQNSVFVIRQGNKSWFYYFSKPKDLKLKKANIEKSIVKSSYGYKITLKSPTLQKNVFLYTKVKGHFSNNFFDLMPNEDIEIEFETDVEIEHLDLKIKTLNQLMN